VIAFDIDGTVRTFDDYLNTGQAGRVFVDQDTLFYRIKAFWITEAK